MAESTSHKSYGVALALSNNKALCKVELAGYVVRQLSLNAPSPTRRTALTLPEKLPVETWTQIGEQLLRVSNLSAWWLGDWLIYGQTVYPDRYRRAMAETSLDYHTLRNYAWVAGKFHESRRRESLSFQHHAEVAGLPPADQDHWLDFAEKMKWSRNKLRQELRWSNAGPDPDDYAVSLHVNVASTRQIRWKQAADKEDYGLLEWVIRVLDDAADRSLKELSDGISPR